MAIDGRKLVNYLAHNISLNQIAIALNLSPSRVSQLATEEKVLEAVEKRKTQIAEEGLTDIADLKTIKKSLMGRMEDLVHGCESLGEAVRAMEAIDKMTSTKLGQEDETSGVQQVIMQVPIFIQNNYGDGDKKAITLDSRNRIVGINGRSMAQMPTQGVLNILNSKKEVIDGSDSSIEADTIGTRKASELDLSALQV